MKRMLTVVLLSMGVPAFHCHAASPAQSLAHVTSSNDYVEIRPSDSIAIDLRYATTNNFMGTNLYDVFDRAFLHRDAAAKLLKAADALKARHPGYKLLVFDALRPRSVQQLLWDRVKGTPQQSYVANPASGSIHNFGFAVDLSVVDENGKELDMGTSFDAFEPLAQPRLEEKFLKEGRLTTAQLKHRQLLRDVMVQAGFLQLPLEWWHYDSKPKQDVRSHYKIVE